MRGIRRKTKVVERSKNKATSRTDYVRASVGPVMVRSANTLNADAFCGGRRIVVIRISR